MLSPIASVTHAHLVYVLAQELKTSHRDGDLQILDTGCGNGKLLLACHRHFPTLLDRAAAFSGFDVTDSRVQRSDFFDSTASYLAEEAPNVDWTSRLRLISTDTPWPYADRTFDATVSNQVLEHVIDVDFFIHELSRVLRPGGVSINLFPVVSLLVEGHVGVPLAHRISSDDVRRAYLSQFARLGLSRLGPMRMSGSLSPEAFGVTRAEYVATQTAYRSFRELAKVAHRHGLTASYRWTPQFYLLKLAYVLGRDLSRMYDRPLGTPLLEWLTFGLLSRLSSVTVVFAKDRGYDPDAVDAGHLSSA